MILEQIYAQAQGFIGKFGVDFIPTYIIPNIALGIQILILLVVGYIIGRIAKSVVVRLLGVLGFKRVSSKIWAEGVLKVAGYRGTIVSLIGDLVKWLIYILFLGLILQTLGFGGVADFFTQIAIFIPRFIGAVIIFVLGFLVAEFFGTVFEEGGRKFSDEELVGKLAGGMAKYLISIVAMIMALALIGIDTFSLSIMFAILFGAMVVLIMLGLRDMFPNYTAGISLRKGLKIGVRVKIGNASGVVERITPTAVYLRDKGKRIVVPNTLFISEPHEETLKEE